ncbi:MAG TPA: hypothetical protein VN660_05380 [Steroidobacteraceae bacterium]|nr:hypothetical protein [Steroidobacteraceae bacterium]
MATTKDRGAVPKGAMMKKLSADLSRLSLQLLLLPFVLVWVPVMFAMAWVHEAFEDLRAPRLRPAPVLLPARDGAPAVLPSLARRPLRR